MSLLNEEKDSLNSEDYKELGEKIGLEEQEVENREILQVVDELDNLADRGGAILKKFKIRDENEVFEYVQDTSGGNIYGFFNQNMIQIITSQELNETKGNIYSRKRLPQALVEETWPGKFWYSPVFVDGYIAWLLIRGGAHSQPFKNRQSEAKKLGQQFEEEIVNERYEDFLTWRIKDLQWSDWFQGIRHWDDTLIAVDKKKKEFWLFKFTSTD